MFSKKGEKKSFIDWAHTEIENLKSQIEIMKQTLVTLEKAYNDHSHPIGSFETKGTSYSYKTRK